MSMELFNSILSLPESFRKGVWAILMCTEQGVDDALEKTWSCIASSKDTNARYRTRQSCICLYQLSQSPLLLFVQCSFLFIDRPRLLFLSLVVPPFELFEDLRMSIER